METFTVKSTSLQEGQMVPEHYLYNSMGCHGDNVSPELEWSGAPEGTKSYAVTLFDPDAPRHGGWWHWGVVNIPADVKKIEEGASNEGKLPGGATELITNFGKAGYGGPCPPKSHHPHRYVFTVYALGTDKLEVDGLTSSESIKNRLESNTLAKASFMVKYGHLQ